MCWDEWEPHSAEYDHAEGDEFGLVEGVGQLAAQEGQEEAEGGQQADVAQEQVEPRGPRVPALHHYLLSEKTHRSLNASTAVLKDKMNKPMQETIFYEKYIIHHYYYYVFII